MAGWDSIPRSRSAIGLPLRCASFGRDLKPTRGRHLLSGALYELQKALGEGVILASGTELPLAIRRPSVDA
jgi:hypothetical protein